jgi:hypothetical protein
MGKEGKKKGDRSINIFRRALINRGCIRIGIIKILMSYSKFCTIGIAIKVGCPNVGPGSQILWIVTDPIKHSGIQNGCNKIPLNTEHFFVSWDYSFGQLVYRMDYREIWVRFTAGARDISLLLRLVLGAHSASNPVNFRSLDKADGTWNSPHTSI